MKSQGIQGSFSEYKGKPLVRNGEDIYWGNMSDKGILHIWIMIPEENPTKLMIELMSTNDLKPVAGKQKMVTSLAEAFEFGEAWLSVYNK